MNISVDFKFSKVNEQISYPYGICKPESIQSIMRLSKFPKNQTRTKWAENTS